MNYVWIKHYGQVYLVAVGRLTGHQAYTEARRLLNVNDSEITMWGEARQRDGVFTLPKGFTR